MDLLLFLVVGGRQPLLQLVGLPRRDGRAGDLLTVPGDGRNGIQLLHDLSMSDGDRCGGSDPIRCKVCIKVHCRYLCPHHLQWLIRYKSVLEMPSHYIIS